MTDQGLDVGSIIISNQIDSTGHPNILTSLPELEDVPLVTQLGMLELAKDTLLRMEELDDD